MEIKSGLNSRQYRLYDYLKSNGDQWIFQEQIAKDLPAIYPADEDDFKDFHNSSIRHVITNDIRAINESDYLPKPILTGKNGVKIANEHEFDLFIGANINAAVRRLNRLKKLAKKGDKDGQYRIKLSEYQKEIVEAFID